VPRPATRVSPARGPDVRRASHEAHCAGIEGARSGAIRRYRGSFGASLPWRALYGAKGARCSSQTEVASATSYLDAQSALLTLAQRSKLERPLLGQFHLGGDRERQLLKSQDSRSSKSPRWAARGRAVTAVDRLSGNSIHSPHFSKKPARPAPGANILILVRRKKANTPRWHHPEHDRRLLRARCAAILIRVACAKGGSLGALLPVHQQEQRPRSQSRIALVVNLLTYIPQQ
jgi:hypothetical protein